MASLKQLKLKRESINKTRKVTRAMEAVSAVKMRKAQERALGGRAYATGAMRILNNLAQTSEADSHELFQTRTKGAVGLIIITSDKGLAGSLNSAVIKRVDAFLETYDKDTEKVFICIGRRGHDYIKRKGFEALHFEENKSDEVTEAEMQRITDVILKEHVAGNTQHWHVAYTNFKSTFEQEPMLRQVLPLDRAIINDIVEGITPEKGKYSDTDDDAKTLAYTVEPSPEEILSLVIPSMVNIYVYHALLETKASEHSARMVAMKNATDKAGELSHVLKLKFNKARQAAITREVSEITSGIEAMK